MRVNKCDRCKGEVVNLWVVQFWVPDAASESQYKAVEHIELCEGCKQDLRGWVKRGVAQAMHE